MSSYYIKKSVVKVLNKTDVVKVVIIVIINAIIVFMQHYQGLKQSDILQPKDMLQ